MFFVSCRQEQAERFSGAVFADSAQGVVDKLVRLGVAYRLVVDPLDWVVPDGARDGQIRVLLRGLAALVWGVSEGLVFVVLPSSPVSVRSLVGWQVEVLRLQGLVDRALGVRDGQVFRLVEGGVMSRGEVAGWLGLSRARVYQIVDVERARCVGK